LLFPPARRSFTAALLRSLPWHLASAPAQAPEIVSFIASMLAVAAALPWIVLPIVVLRRARDSRSLNEFDAGEPDDAPLVTVIVPARNEAPRIARCVHSLLASSYPRFEVIVVDDHSSDGTGELARAIALSDPRLRVIVPPPLPKGWFGKQWACTSGAAEADGDVLLFTDADTWHAPDLLPRAIHALEQTHSDGLSVAGRQEMVTFWERLVQPMIFAMLLFRFGGTERVNNSRRASDRIANGQWLMLRRSSYDRIGGHAAVRDRAAEDLAIAQEMHLHGLRLTIILGLDQFSTRMYESRAELIRGWSKNSWAAGIESSPGGRLGRALFAPGLIFSALTIVGPPVVLSWALLNGSAGLALWAGIATGASLLWWAGVYTFAGAGIGYSLLYPLGGATLLWIFVRAIARGRRVEWKGREYRARIAPPDGETGG
jgi:chlorobactene glucosyltransferase